MPSDRNGSARNPVLAFHVYNPDVFISLMRYYGSPVVSKPVVNVAVTNWETRILPKVWVEVLSAYEILAAPSRFTAAAIAAATHRPVGVLPNHVPAHVVRVRRRTDLHFVFVTMCDHLSSFHRKNPLGVIEAFKRALCCIPLGVTCELRVKCHEGTPSPAVRNLQEAVGDLPVEVLTVTLDDAAMNRLWDDTDCLISLHRSEGFGLPVAEALARGIPVISSRQGGVLDFADDKSCFMVGGDAAVRVADYGAYAECSGWIEPDLQQAARHIAAVTADYAAAVARAKIGRDIVQQRLGQQAVVSAVQQLAGRALQSRGI
jgi:glycosyltransferase involved in cell wall biosynthesis